MAGAGSLPGELEELRSKVEQLRLRTEQAERDSSRTLVRTTRLAQVVKVLGEHTDLERLSGRAVCELAELFDADIALLLVGPDHSLSLGGSWGLRPRDVPEGTVDLAGLTIGGSEIGRASEMVLPEWIARYGLEHLAWVRLFARGESRGVLLLARRADEPFEPDDERELRAMATRIGLALDNGLLHRRMAEHLERLEQLHSFTTDLAALLDLGFDGVAEAIVERISADAGVGAVALYIPQGERLVRAAASGREDSFPVWTRAEQIGERFGTAPAAFPLKHGSWESGAVIVEQIPSDFEDASTFLAHFAEVAGLVVEKALLLDHSRSQALLDPLTSLPNRTFLTERLDIALSRSERLGTGVGVIFLDLDRFKVINDSMGHGAGDLLLVEVARRLREAARASDTVARLGGDEFIVICEDLQDPSDILTVAARIGAAVGDWPIVIEGSKVTVTASQGIALTAMSGRSAEALLRDADTALYRAKERGRDCCQVFDERFREEAVARLGVERELREAIEQGRLRALYQPIVSIRDGVVTAGEALLRYEDRDGRLVPPAEFLAVAEESGVMAEMDTWILREACREAAKWRLACPPGTNPPAVSVNIASPQGSRDDLPATVAAALAEAGIPPSLLHLEVTEGALMEAGPRGARNLAAVEAVGVPVGIDDFGTGYSSLARLKQLPVQYLKIDRSFIEGLGSDRQDSAIIGAIMGLARALELTVVAEGVERPEQLEELARIGCQYVQGFYFSQPLTGEEFEALVARGAIMTPHATVG